VALGGQSGALASAPGDAVSESAAGAVAATAWVRMSGQAEEGEAMKHLLMGDTTVFRTNANGVMESKVALVRTDGSVRIYSTALGTDVLISVGEARTLFDAWTRHRDQREWLSAGGDANFLTPDPELENDIRAKFGAEG
jgi:hypothetical protein